MQDAGMIIGGHTHEHRPLATLRYPELFRDLSRNWDLIQKNLRPQAIWPFSYPYGKADSFNRNTVEILRQLGYRISLCTEPGNNLPGIDLFAIRRVDCKDILAATRSARKCRIMRALARDLTRRAKPSPRPLRSLRAHSFCRLVLHLEMDELPMSVSPTAMASTVEPEEFGNSSTLWIEPIEGWATPQAQGTLGLSRVAVLPRLARREGSLQAGGTGSCMGDSSALAHHADFQRHFRHVRQRCHRTELPYPLFAFVALVPWNFFATSLAQSSNSVVGSANLITKVYFPRLAIPLASVLAGLVDFALSFVVLLGMMVYYHHAPTIHVLWLPAFHPAGAGGRGRHGVLALRDEREIPRRALRGAVSRAVLDVRFADHLSEQHDSGSLPHAVCAEPHRGRGRRLPLGAAGNENGAWAGASPFPRPQRCCFCWAARCISGGWKPSSRTSYEQKTPTQPESKRTSDFRSDRGNEAQKEKSVWCWWTAPITGG